MTLNTGTLYETGLHWLGVGHHFIIFPKKLVSLDLTGKNTVPSRTSDGIAVSLDVRVFYRLTSTNNALAALYLNFENHYEDAFARLARSVVRDGASLYTAFDFYNIRSEVESKMLELLTVAFADWFGSVTDFKLENFALPTDFINAVETTDQTRQEKDSVAQEKQIASTQTSTKVESAQKLVNVTLFTAAQTALQIGLQYSAQINATTAAIEVEILAYSALQTELQFSPEELQSFVWLYSLQKSPNTKKLLSVGRPDLLKL